MVYKIEHVREECIGCGACSACAPKYWVMADDGKTDLIGSTKEGEIELLELDEDFEINKEAEESCPVNCIHIKENISLQDGVADDYTEDKAA